MQHSYVVTVKGNLVAEIRPCCASEQPAATGTPLEIGTALAGNFARSGCIDGVYGFADTEAARTFAVLCLNFSKALVERRLAAIQGLPAGFDAYACDEQPASGLSD